jgi:hypothetical protein
LPALALNRANQACVDSDGDGGDEAGTEVHE